MADEFFSVFDEGTGTSFIPDPQGLEGDFTAVFDPVRDTFVDPSGDSFGFPDFVDVDGGLVSQSFSETPQFGGSASSGGMIQEVLGKLGNLVGFGKDKSQDSAFDVEAWDRSHEKMNSAGTNVPESVRNEFALREATKNLDKTKLTDPSTWGPGEWLAVVGLGLAFWQNQENRRFAQKIRREDQSREERLIDEQREFELERLHEQDQIDRDRGGGPINFASGNIFG